MKPYSDKEDALEKWMREITDSLIYQPEIPMEHKKAIVDAYARYRKSIGKPLIPGKLLVRI